MDAITDEATAFLQHKNSTVVNRSENNENKMERVIREDKYNVKHSIDLMSLSSRKICLECAKLKESPVYSDRYVYRKQPLLAREASLLQISRKSVVFKRQSNEEKLVDFMPICKLMKTNAAGIFYSVGLPYEFINLKANLEPSIVLLESSPHNFHTSNDNTQVYHRVLNKGYSRVSEKGVAEQSTFPLGDQSRALDFKLRIDYDVDSRGWIRNTSRRECTGNELERNRSSLLMLEPLLLMSVETTDRKKKYDKNRLARSEHLKLIKIVIAYILTFFILLSITFYLVYFK